MPSIRIAIVGPTASGKTAVGIELARILGGEIVSADSQQVYRRLDIGTAKPTAEEQKRARFHAIDVADPDVNWTVVDHKTVSEAAIGEIIQRGRVPMVVGGTGLYVRALTTELDVPAAPPDPDFRAGMRALAEERGGDWLWCEVKKVDPQAAARLHRNDFGRLIRALEVHRATGVTLTELHAQNRAKATPQPWVLFGLNHADRAVLYRRIEERVDAMMELGFEREVRDLLAQGFGRDLRSMRSLGYRQLASYLHGEMGLTEAIEQIKKETRQFAKRQLIWFRADDRIQWLDTANKSAAEIAGEVARAVQERVGMGTYKGDTATDE